MQCKQMAAAAAMAMAAITAQAQTQAAGLWENTVTMKSADGRAEKAMAEMQKQLAAMPPEQRKQMEAMLAKNGVSAGAKGMSTKVCVSKEQAARPVDPQVNANCKTSDVQRAGGNVKFKFTCTQPPSSGEGEWAFTSDKAYAGKVTTTSDAGGKTQQMTIEMAGTWLAADCGDVKPRTVPAK